VDDAPDRPARRRDPQLRRDRADQDERGRRCCLRRAGRGRLPLDRPAQARPRGEGPEPPSSAESLSERERALLEHGVRAWVEEILALPSGLAIRPRRRLGRDRHRHARRRRGRGVQKPLQAAGPRGRRAEVHGRRRRGLRPRLAARLSCRRGAPPDRRRRHRAAHRDPGEEQPARVLQPDPVHRPDRLHEGRHPRPRAVHRPFPQDRAPRGARRDLRGHQEERRHRLQKPRRPAHDHLHVRRVSHRRRGRPQAAHADRRDDHDPDGRRAGGQVRRLRRADRADPRQPEPRGRPVLRDPRPARAPLADRPARLARGRLHLQDGARGRHS
jgi:hypothetical protein